MNKLIRAAGMLSLGTASLAVQTFVCAADDGKSWNISAALRGFYDDNIYTRPNGPGKLDSFGFEISPGIKYRIATDDTTVRFSYTYSAKYFDGRPQGTDKWDQSHIIDAALKHSFSPRVSLDLNDRFAVAQEPEQIGQGGTEFRANGNNKSNRASIAGTIGLTSQFGLVIGYSNNFYDYEDQAYAVSLNRMEHNPSVDLTYQLKPATVLVAGYAYSIVDFDTVSPDRDNQSHFLRVGIDQKFSQELTASARVGAQIVDYAFAGQKNITSPYADLSLKYAFTPDASMTVGVSHKHNATDVIQAEDQESTAVYGVFAYKFTANLSAKLIAQYQNSEFNSTEADLNGKTEDYYSFGFNLGYMVTTNISLDASYYYDKLESDNSVALLAPRSFSRNRVFLGVRFSY